MRAFIVGKCSLVASVENVERVYREIFTGTGVAKCGKGWGGGGGEMPGGGIGANKSNMRRGRERKQVGEGHVQSAGDNT